MAGWWNGSSSRGVPGTPRAGLDDCRAAATRDYEAHAADLQRRVTCQLLAIWGRFGKMHALFGVLGTWKDKAPHAEVHPLPCGHFIPDKALEAPVADLKAGLRG